MPVQDPQNLDIPQGQTWSVVFRWAQPRKVYKPITNAFQEAPLRLEVSDHGIPDGWDFRITGVRGMTRINDRDCIAIVLNANEIEVNEINAAAFEAYTSGGWIEYLMPMDLDGFTARMQIRESLDSDDVLEELTTDNDGIVLDNEAKTITVQMPAEETAAIDWKSGYYSLELTDDDGRVFGVAAGRIVLCRDATR